MSEAVLGSGCTRMEHSSAPACIRLCVSVQGIQQNQIETKPHDNKLSSIESSCGLVEVMVIFKKEVITMSSEPEQVFIKKTIFVSSGWMTGIICKIYVDSIKYIYIYILQ